MSIRQPLVIQVVEAHDRSVDPSLGINFISAEVQALVSMELNYPKGSDYNAKKRLAQNVADYMQQHIRGVVLSGIV